jgi:hypothetical protein
VGAVVEVLSPRSLSGISWRLTKTSNQKPKAKSQVHGAYKITSCLLTVLKDIIIYIIIIINHKNNTNNTSAQSENRNYAAG